MPLSDLLKPESLSQGVYRNPTQDSQDLLKQHASNAHEHTTRINTWKMGVCCSVWKWISSPSCMSSASSTSSARAALPTPLRACAGFSPAAAICEVGLVAPAPTAHKYGIARKVGHAFKKLKSWCCRVTHGHFAAAPNFLPRCMHL